MYMYDSYTKCTLLKANGECADQAEWKEALSGQYLCCSHATTSSLLMTRIYVLLAVECLWMIKLNKNIISVLAHMTRSVIKPSLYFQLKRYFSNYKSVL